MTRVRTPARAVPLLTERSSRRVAWTPMRRKLTQRGRERREQLITCAARLFAERGYHPTSVSDIVDGARRRQGRLLLVLLLEGGAARRAAEVVEPQLAQAAAAGDRRRTRSGAPHRARHPHDARVVPGPPRVLRDHRVRRDRRDVRAGAAPQPRDRDRRHDPPPQGRHRRRPHRRRRPRDARARHPRRRRPSSPGTTSWKRTNRSIESRTSPSRSACAASPAEPLATPGGTLRRRRRGCDRPSCAR